MRSSWRSRVAFAGVGVVAFGLRVWGIAFARGQPRGRPDEELFLVPALRMFDGDLNPGLLDYGFPEGFFLVLHGLLRIEARVLAWWFGEDVNLGCLFAINPTALLLTGRYFSACVGTLTLVPTALLASRLVEPALRRSAALVGALLLAVNYLHVRESHFAVTDATMTFFLAWAAWAIVRTAEEDRPRHALLAGMFTGAATAVKWPGLFLVPLLILVLATRIWRSRHGRVARHVRTAVVSLALAMLVFVALCPHVPTHLGETYTGLVSHVIRYGPHARGHLQDPDVDPGRGIQFHSLVTLPTAFGWLGIAAAVVGLGMAFRTSAPAAWPSFLYLALLYGVAVGPTRMLFVRYCMPVVVVITALAAAGLVSAADRLGRRLRSPAARRIGVVTLVAIASIAPLVRAVQANRLLARADTRELAARWILAHAPDGATMVPQVAYTNVYAADARGVVACGAVLPPALRAPVPRLVPWGEDWGTHVARGRAGWGAIAETALMQYWNAPGMQLNPDYLTRGIAVLGCGKHARVRGLEQLPTPCFEEVARFGPGQPSCDAVYDLFDQFFLPFSGFDGIERPGPEVTVYRNVCKR